MRANTPAAVPLSPGRRHFLTGLASGILTATSGRFARASEGEAAGDGGALPVALRALRASLAPTQVQELVLGVGHDLRLRADANFAVTSPRLRSDFYTDRQRQALRQVLALLLSPQGLQLLERQMEDDAGGLGGYHLAFFEHPPAGPALTERRPELELLLTGRHVTLRAHTAPGALPPGPRVYGHGEERPQRSLYADQTALANAIYRSLPPERQARALVEDAPYEESVALPAPGQALAGVPLAELAAPGMNALKALVETLCRNLRAPDAALLSQRLLGARALAQSRIVFYREGDLQDDRVWDLWRLHGPDYVWHFRGAPHVHAYLNLA